MDFFNEFIVRKTKDAKDYAIICATIFCGIILIFSSMLFIRYLGSFFLLIIAGIIYGMYYVLSSLNVEYEYIVTNGEMDIDKIIARRRRKRLVSVDSKNFEYFAPYKENHASAFSSSDISKTINAASSIKAANAYFALYHNNNEKICLIFEPTDKMIKEFSLRVPRSVYYTE